MHACVKDGHTTSQHSTHITHTHLYNTAHVTHLSLHISNIPNYFHKQPLANTTVSKPGAVGINAADNDEEGDLDEE
jgi:hypothetical protein